MARPTDPAKLAVYLARQARASKAYRERKAAAATGKPVAPQYAQKAPARYRPPAVTGVVERAATAARVARERRSEIIGALPSVRNPQALVYVPRDPPRGLPDDKKTTAGRERQAQRIREAAQAQKVAVYGKNRAQTLRTDLTTGPKAEQLNENMNEHQRARFAAAVDRIARIPQQALGILFKYEGGQGDYLSAHDSILASPASRDIEGGIGKLENLAALGERAKDLYSPKNIGRLNV